MHALFKSTALQAEFDQNGFVRVPFLSEAQTNELLQQYETLQQAHYQIGIPFITTSHSNNPDLIAKADAMIAHYFTPLMDELLTGYERLFGNFLIKQPSANSVTPLHQDTVFVDETQYASISVWVSLHHTTKQNGCMRFVKGSHKFLHTHRPAHQYPWAFENVKPELEKLLVDYPAKKGEAFIFHHGVIHASYANQTGSPRVAAIMAAYPKGAQLLMQFQNPADAGTMQTYAMTRDAFIHYVKGAPPHLGKLIKEEPVNYGQLTAMEFNAMLPQHHRGVWNKLNQLIVKTFLRNKNSKHGAGV